MRILTFGLVVCVLLGPRVASAQETRGAVEGSIRDSSGAVLPGVTVEVASQSGVFATTTDSNGEYRFPALTPARYVIKASVAGFSPGESAPVYLAVGQILKVNLTLAVAGVSENLHVVAESPTIDVKQTTAATNLAAVAIDKLPKGRDFTSLVTLAPGANQESRSGGISVDGASAAENKYYLDGVDTTNLRTGISATPVLTDFIEELQVKSSGYAAEFGGAMGGVISVISKSGTNQLRGEAGTYLNTVAMNGDLALNNVAGTAGNTIAGSGVASAGTVSGTRRELRLFLDGRNLAETVEYPKDDYSRWDPHFQLGGPIVRDRLWFWAGYTPQIESTKRTVTFRSNQQTGTFASDETTQNMIGKVTWQATRGTRANISAQYRPSRQEGRLPALNGTGNPLIQFADLGLEQDNTATTTSVDWVASSRLFFNTKFNYLRYDTRDLGIPSENWYTFTGSNALYETRPDLIKANGYESVLTNRARTKDLYTRLGWTADATIYVTAAGQHTFKGGVQFERIGNDVADFEQQPHVTVVWNQSRPTLAGDIVRGIYGYWSWRQFGTVGKVNVNNLGLFFQDAWTVNNRLTVNAGVRTERETVPSYRSQLDGIEFSLADKLAPRVGVAYDLKGDGRWKAYGSWGIFYDTMKLELPRGAFGGDVWVEDYYTLDTLDWNTLMVNGNKPGVFIESVDYRIPSNDPACPECGAIDPALKPFKQQEFVAGLEHELSPRLSVGARFVHKQVDRAIEDVGVIVPGLGEVFYIANPGEGVATTIEGPQYPGLPKVKRQYDALEVKFNRRFANSYSLGASYTLSRLYGNYPGLASSDEIARVAPNVTRLFDGLVMAFRPGGEAVYGRLNTDRPHQFKISGVYQLKTDTTVAAVFRAASGVPVTREMTMISSLPVFYQGRESDGRMPWLTVTDLNLVQDVPMPGKLRAQLTLNVLNLFDQKKQIDVYRRYNRNNLPVSKDTFFGGFDPEARYNSLGLLVDPRFLQNQYWQAPREVRLGLKVLF